MSTEYAAEHGVSALPRAHANPLGRALLRSTPEDFRVAERLSFAPQGDGEHVYLYVRKRNANTDWVARRIADLAGVPRVGIGYAGKKDRAAVTEQWFSVHMAGRGEPDWSRLVEDDIEVLEAVRHGRKLRRGALAANRFDLVLRNLDARSDDLAQRLARIAELGVPNYFGEQRFGIDGGNLRRADALFAGKLRERNRTKRGMYLSAARSWLFNLVLARRVGDQSWNRVLEGEVLMLDGTHSLFDASANDGEIHRRVSAQDIHPTGPLWGRGELRPALDVRRLEEEVLEPFNAWKAGLERAGMAQERRALRLRVHGLAWNFDAPGTLRLRFQLGPGSYATAVLRELVEYSDQSRDRNPAS